MEFKQEDWNEEWEGYVVEASTVKVGEYVKVITKCCDKDGIHYCPTAKVYQVAGAEHILGTKGTFNVVLDDTTDISRDRLVTANQKVLVGFTY
jgi:hypothetical protein